MNWEEFQNLSKEELQRIEYWSAHYQELAETPGFMEKAAQARQDYLDGKTPAHKILEKRPIEEIVNELEDFIESKFSFLDEIKLNFLESENNRQSSEYFQQVNELLDRIYKESESKDLSSSLSHLEINVLLSQIVSHLRVLQALSVKLKNYNYPSNSIEALRVSAFAYLEENQSPYIIWRDEDFQGS